MWFHTMNYTQTVRGAQILIYGASQEDSCRSILPTILEWVTAAQLRLLESRKVLSQCLSCKHRHGETEP